MTAFLKCSLPDLPSPTKNFSWDTKDFKISGGKIELFYCSFPPAISEMRGKGGECASAPAVTAAQFRKRKRLRFRGIPLLIWGPVPAE